MKINVNANELYTILTLGDDGKIGKDELEKLIGEDFKLEKYTD